MILFDQEWFTGRTLIETILFSASLCYLFFKYQSSKIIRHYQDSTVNYSKNKRRWHDAFVNISVFVVQPICLDLLYGCFALSLLKLTAPDRLGSIAKVVYSIYLFNKNIIKQPLTALILIFSVLAVLHILSHTFLKKIKKYVKYISFPFKLAAILTLFINVDKGISNRYISWKINQNKPIEKDNITFNATEEQEKNLKQVTDAYTEYVVNRFSEVDNEKNDPKSSNQSEQSFYHALTNIINSTEKEPTIKLDIYEGKAYSKRTYSEEEKNIIEKCYKKQSFDETIFKATDLYQEAHSVSQGNLSQFLDILNDARNTIHKVEQSATENVLKDILKQYLGKTFLFNGSLLEAVPFYGFAKDKIFDLLKDKFVSGFFSLIKKSKLGNISKEDLNTVFLYLKDQCGESFYSAKNYVEKSINLVEIFSDQYSYAIKIKTDRSPLKLSFTTESLNEFVTNFPHDLNNEIYNKITPLFDALKNHNEEALEKIDFIYLQKTLSNSNDARVFDLLRELEKYRDINIANKTNTSEAWTNLLEKYPNIESKKIIQQNIRISEETEAFETAKGKNTEEVWISFTKKYPNSQVTPKIMEYVKRGEFNVIARETESISPAFTKPLIISLSRESEGFFPRLFKLLSKFLRL